MTRSNDGTKMIKRKDVLEIISQLIYDEHELVNSGEIRHSRKLAVLYEVKQELAALPVFVSKDHACADPIPLGPELMERATLAMQDTSVNKGEASKALYRFIRDIRVPIEELREYIYE